MSIMQYFDLDSAPVPLAWEPSWLFPEAWFDPSDLSAALQDAHSPVPITAGGQPVGRIFDKSQWGGETLSEILAG